MGPGTLNRIEDTLKLPLETGLQKGGLRPPTFFSIEQNTLFQLPLATALREGGLRPPTELRAYLWPPTAHRYGPVQASGGLRPPITFSIDKRTP